MSKSREKGPNERPISDNLVEAAEAIGDEQWDDAREHLRCAITKIDREASADE